MNTVGYYYATAISMMAAGAAWFTARR